MIPIGDDNSDRRTTPIVNWLLIAANVFVFVALQGFGTNQRFTLAYAAVPAEILTGEDIARPIIVRDEYGQAVERIDLQPTPIPVYLTLITAMFMHGGLAHIFGNMLYLAIFGDNVEDVLGHARYLFFYLASGVVAVLAQTLVNPASTVPMIGASGAVSGVLGAYLILFPRAGVLTAIVFGFFIRLVRIPAVIVLGFWVVVQIVTLPSVFQRAVEACGSM